MPRAEGSATRVDAPPAQQRHAVSRSRIVRAVTLALLVAAATGCSRSAHDNVLVLVRAEDPLSRESGETYAAVYQIPASHVLALAFSDPPLSDSALAGSDSPAPSPVARRLRSDRLTEIDWETYHARIEQPLEAYLAREDPDGEIEILVTTRGLPLRVGRCDPDAATPFPRSCHAAALDAALAGLGRVDAASAGLGQHANPFFRDTRTFSEFRRELPDADLRFLVARLTGPIGPANSKAAESAETGILGWVRALAERTKLFHASEETSPRWQIVTRPSASLRGAAAGALLDPIADRLTRAGYDVCNECERLATDPSPVGLVYANLEHAEIEAAARTRPEDGVEQAHALQRSLAEQAIDLANGGLVIDLTPRGSSPSTSDSNRSTASTAQSNAWCAPFDRAIEDWLAIGALAISTHLGDPTLAGITRPGAQLEAFLSGRPAVEAHFKSVPHLGWMNVFVGDPLLEMPPSEARPGGDRDGDGVPDDQDNCLDDANSGQRDTNEDGIGNRCDPDIDDDGFVGTSWGRIYPVDARGDLERIALTVRSGPYDPDQDLDGDGRVDEQDLALAQLWLFRAPGPSGLR